MAKKRPKASPIAIVLLRPTKNPTGLWGPHGSTPIIQIGAGSMESHGTMLGEIQMFEGVVFCLSFSLFRHGRDQFWPLACMQDEDGKEDEEDTYDRL
jgi:hypothetical protein